MARKRPDNTRPIWYVLLKKYGLRGACHVVRDDVLFDLKHKVDTALPMSRERLFPGEDPAERHRYVASTFDLLDAVIDFAAHHMELADCGYVDIGSGKGKALIHASRYPFMSIRGVDSSAPMHRIAVSNIRRLKLCHRIEVDHQSASELTLEPHERVLYFFNSFSGDTLVRFLDLVAQSPRNGPGLLIYSNPTERNVVQARFERIATRLFEPGHCEVDFYLLPG